MGENNCVFLALSPIMWGFFVPAIDINSGDELYVMSTKKRVNKVIVSSVGESIFTVLNERDEIRAVPRGSLMKLIHTLSECGRFEPGESYPISTITDFITSEPILKAIRECLLKFGDMWQDDTTAFHLDNFDVDEAVDALFGLFRDYKNKNTDEDDKSTQGILSPEHKADESFYLAC